MEKESKQEAIKSSSIDTSSLILLSSKILKEELGESVSDSLNKINSYYLNTKYSEALDEILVLASRVKDPVIYELINSQIELSKNNSSPERNESRRYFETIFSQKLWDSQGIDSYESSQKLVDVMKQNTKEGSELKEQLDNIPIIRSKEANEVAISYIRSFSELPEMESITRNLRSGADSLSNLKDRGKKRDFEGVAPLSYNPGIIKANQALPVDQLLDHVIQDKVVDSFDIDIKKVDGYSKNHKQVPYVNSVSGTAYGAVATLSKYMEIHKNDKNLEKDVNNIVRGFISFTCMKGYHSMEEMIDVFNTSESKAVFDKYNVKIAPLPESMLEASISQAAEYSKKINLHSIMNIEIKETYSKNKQSDLSNIQIPKKLKNFLKSAKLVTSNDRKFDTGYKAKNYSRAH